MKTYEELLQERLERLEAGESLASCLAGLPEVEADLLQLAAALHQMPYPEQAAAATTFQRAELMRAAQEEKPMMSQSPGKPANVGKPARSIRLPLVVLAGAAALALICAVIGAAIAGGLVLTQSGGEAGLAQNPIFGGLAGINQPSAPDPQSGLLTDVRGVVEIKSGGDGDWVAAENGQVVTAGTSIRTRALSSAVLLLYDGSKIRLEAGTELSIDTLDAPRSGPRTVLLTQAIGQTQHDVSHSDDAGSRYELTTPSGVASVKGTSFTAIVTATLISRFNVEQGAVAVTNLDVTVIVVAGQSSMVRPGKTPGTPIFLISGFGVVSQMGGTWIVGGQAFQVDNTTAIGGNPQIGDTVAVQGRILASGANFADSIWLVHRAQENRFSFTGAVDSMGGSSMVIGGTTVALDANTGIDAGIAVGDTVAVGGVILEDGTLLAEYVSLVEENAPGQPFGFTGVVQGMGDTWTISGVAVSVDANTGIEQGIVAGDVVEVSGWILPDGTWLAGSIAKAEEDEREFGLTGTVTSTGPWVVAGVSFETDNRTAIDEGIKVGDLVSVSGVILEDGTWLAGEIALVEEDEANHFQFVGTVTSIAPLAVSGPAFTTDEHTEISGDLAVGDAVKVKGRILPDGTWLAEEIVRLEEDDNVGCMDVSALVASVNAGQIVLLNGEHVEEDEDTEVEGQVQVASVIIIQSCTDENGNVTIISIIVIYQLDALPTPMPSDGNHEGDHEDDDDD